MTPRGEQTIRRQDVVRALRERRPIAGRDLSIRCESVSAIALRDLLELFLLLSRVGRWRWVDRRDGVSERQAAGRILWNLARDAVSWLPLYLSIRREVGLLERRRGAQPARHLAEPAATVLFLRSDHWFDVRSGGSVGHLAGVIGALRSSGYRVHVSSTDYLAQVPRDDDFHLHAPSYETGRNVPDMMELLGSREMVRGLADSWDRWSPSVIYQRYSLGNFSGVLLREQRGVPYICEYNGSIPWKARNWDRQRLFHENLIERIELLNLQAADLVVVLSQPMEAELVSRGVEPAKILVNPNGVDPERFSPAVDGSDVRRRLGLEGTTVVGFIGTMGRWHGVEVLAEAFGKLLQEEPRYRTNTRLLLIGDGQAAARTSAILGHTGALAASVMTGVIPQDEAPAYLAACDLFVSPHVRNPDGSAFFGSPTKLFEYMAMGRGIVASRLEQIGRILDHGRTAWLVEPGDVESLKDGLQRLLDDREKRDALGRAARREAVERFTWERHVTRTMEAFQARCPALR